MTDIGGFGAKLKLRTDQADFDKGVKNLDRLGKSAKGSKIEFKSLGQDVLNLTGKMAAAFLVLAGAMSKLGMDSAKTLTNVKSQAFWANKSTAELMKWQGVAKLAGMDTGGMADAMADLNSGLQKLASGDASKFQSFAKAFTVGTGKDFGEYYNPQTKEYDLMGILKAFEGSKDQQKSMGQLSEISPYLAEILVNLKARGANITEAYSASASRQGGVTTADIAAAGKLELAQSKAMLNFDNALTKLGTYMAGPLTRAFESFDTWLSANKATLEAFGRAMGEITSNILGFAGSIGKFIFGDESTVTGRNRPSLVGRSPEQIASSRQVQNEIDKAVGTKTYSGLSRGAMESLAVSASDWAGSPVSGAANSMILDILKGSDAKTDKLFTEVLGVKKVTDDWGKMTITFQVEGGEQRNVTFNREESKALKAELTGAGIKIHAAGGTK